jgi:DNA transformation protein
MTRPVAELPNLGPVTAGRLAEIGIVTDGDLRRVGAVAAWLPLRHLFGRAVTRNALHAMEAALLGRDWRELPEEVKARLDAAANARRSDVSP